MLDSDYLDDWMKHPITECLFKTLKERKIALTERVCSGTDLTKDHCEAVMGQLTGKIAIIEELLSLELIKHKSIEEN